MFSGPHINYNVKLCRMVSLIPLKWCNLQLQPCMLSLLLCTVKLRVHVSPYTTFRLSHQCNVGRASGHVTCGISRRKDSTSWIRWLIRVVVTSRMHKTGMTLSSMFSWSSHCLQIEVLQLITRIWYGLLRIQLQRVVCHLSSRSWRETCNQVSYSFNSLALTATHPKHSLETLSAVDMLKPQPTKYLFW